MCRLSGGESHIYGSGAHGVLQKEDHGRVGKDGWSGEGGTEVQRSRGGVPVEMTNKRKVYEDQREQPEKKNRSEQEEP